MLYTREFQIILTVYCIYFASSNPAVVASKKVLEPHGLDGDEYWSTLECGKYNNDLDILAQFPFSVELNPSPNEFYDNHKSVAELSTDGNTVQRIAIKNEKQVPSSLFCLSNLTSLQIESTPFENDIIPDAFANLETLKYLIVHFTPIKRMTERFGTLNNLEIITFLQCSLTHLPKSLNQLHRLRILNLPYNGLTGIDELAHTNLEVLDLTANNLTEVPVLKNKEHLQFLSLDSNPLKNVESMVNYPNLQYISMYHTGLTSLPASIDNLQELQQLLINDNQLMDLPVAIFNMAKLQYLGANNNLFSLEYIESIKQIFKQYHPTTYIDI